MNHLNILNKVLNFSAQRYLKTAGDLFIYDGDYETALHMVDKTLEIEPEDVRALVLRGDILYCLNRDREALETFNKTLALNPNSVEALISKAGVLDVLGGYKEALQCCYRAFALIKPFQGYLLPSLYDQNILLLLRLKRYRQAQRLLKEAETRLSGEEAQYLMSSYGPIVDRLIRYRHQTRKQAGKLSLRVLNNDQARETLNA